MTSCEFVCCFFNIIDLLFYNLKCKIHVDVDQRIDQFNYPKGCSFNLTTINKLFVVVSFSLHLDLDLNQIYETSVNSVYLYQEHLESGLDL